MSGATLYYMYCADQQAPCVWQMSVCCDERISFIYHSSFYLFIHPSFYHTYSSDVIMGAMIIHQSTPYRIINIIIIYPVSLPIIIILQKEEEERVECLRDSIDGWIDRWMYLHHHHHHQLKSFLPFMLSMMIIDIYMLY